MTFASLVLPEDIGPIRREVQAAVANRRPFLVEYRIRRKDGKVRWVREQGQGVFTETGEIMALEGFITDITESNETMGKLEQANKKLGLLTSITRHDALNMLTVIRGQVALGRMRAMDNAITEALEGIDRMACRIQRTIDFTSQYQQMQAGEPTWQRFDETIRKAIEDHPPGTGLQAFNEVGTFEVFADPMLDKVFHNLIDNSVRHGDAVRSVRVYTDLDRDGLRIIYEDDGQGIPVEQKARIFERGVGHNFGFGLFLSREILGITGITISEEGTPGRGARFVMRVPLPHCRKL